MKSVPPLKSSDMPSGNTKVQLELLTNFIGHFHDEMVKANRTADYRTLSRRLMDMTSVYNLLVSTALSSF